MPRVFISYRRTESGGSAGRIRDRLISVFGRRNVFVDVDKVRYGADFQRAINEAINQCDVFLAVIGQDWVTGGHPARSGGEPGARDYVYGEIEVALQQGITIIPVLVDEATMPAKEAMPASVAALADLNASAIRHTRFDADVKELIRSIDDRNWFWRRIAAVPTWVLPVVLAVVAASAIAYLMRPPIPMKPERETEHAPPIVPPAADTLPLGPPLIKTVGSDIVDRVIVNPPIVAPGELVTINVVTHSSRVQASAIFDQGDGHRRKVAAGYDRNRGGIVIEYPVSAAASPGTVAVKLWIQEIESSKEEQQQLSFEIRHRTLVDAGGLLTLVGLGFRVIPGGEFNMGSARGERDERPVHALRVGEFLLMDHELTYGELTRLVGGDSSVIGRELRSTLPEADQVLAGGGVTWDALPISVTFAESMGIVKAASTRLKRDVRLPTEAEWEYAARGGLASKRYPWGDPKDVVGTETVEDLVLRTLGDCAGFVPMKVHPIKSLTPPNRFGLYDVAGNVWEWTSSVYKPYPYSEPDAADIEKYPFRVIRGGGGLHPEACIIDVAFRGYGDVESSGSTYGLRLAADP